MQQHATIRYIHTQYSKENIWNMKTIWDKIHCINYMNNRYILEYNHNTAEMEQNEVNSGSLVGDKYKTGSDNCSR